MPDWKPLVRERLATLRLDPSREHEILEELAEHLDQRYEELLREGCGEAEARRTSLDELVEPDVLAEYMRPLKQAHVPEPIAPGTPRSALLGDLWQDLRYGIRTLRRQPGFAATAVLTLALGIGATSALVALADATLLRPLPFPEPERNVVIWERTAASQRERASLLNMEDWRARGRSVEAVAGLTPNVGSMVLSKADGTADSVSRQWVTYGYFDALGLRPIVGRFFTADDDRARALVVVLSESLWRSHFDADPALIGTTVRLDGEQWTVVGIAPGSAQVTPTSMWAIRPYLGAPPRVRGFHNVVAIGRLKPGVTVAAAQADLARVSEELAREHAETNAGRSVSIEPMRDTLVGRDLRLTSALLLGVVVAVLLLCCANIASLLLVRATARSRELAIRSALGADRARVARQLLTESLLLALVGGGLGLSLGAGIVRLAPLVIPDGLLPSLVTLTFDGRVAAMSAAITLAAGLLFGMTPAWHAARIAPAAALAAEGRSVTGRGERLRSLLVGGEVAAAVLLLVGAGLLLRTLMAVAWTDRGYRAESVLTMTIDPLSSRYPDDASELQLYGDLRTEISAVPGVRDVAFATTLPLGRSYFGDVPFHVTGEPLPADGRYPTADHQIVSSRYFDTIDLPLVAGRAFTDGDRDGTVPVCIVNEAFVARYLAGRTAVGARLEVRSGDGPESPPVVREIVGVARQVKGRPDETDAFAQIYVPLTQFAVGDVFLLVRPQSGSSAALAPSVKAAIGRVDRDQLVSVRDTITLEAVAASASGGHRFRALLVAAFAALALVMAMVGLFGVMAYAVQQRRRELGLRRVLGARGGDVLRVVLGSAWRTLVGGTVVGLLLALAAGRALATLLYGVSAVDPTTFAVVIVVVVLTTTLAAIVPALRALRVHPAVVLRE